MTPPSYTVLFAIATRIAFTLTPLPAALTTRMELASPSTGIEPLSSAALLSTSGTLRWANSAAPGFFFPCIPSRAATWWCTWSLASV